MSNNTIIKAENLGKSYIIGHEKRERYSALRDVIVNKAKAFALKSKQVFKGEHLILGSELEEFWALKDINFEIKQGERVGIIGRNGAGKSTLLKVLSRITEPSSGRIVINGRIASLLEVGTGFHPELTGRENIYLNGAILGMTRAEVKSKFDEIVDFSGVEKFLDTPVKRYSSGMYVRLAFAVAAHLEPEILVVDEVLAVGDAEFQKKCLGKMEDVSSKEGRTVLFVSHNMGAIKQLCNKGIVLNRGEIYSINNDINEAVSNYNRLIYSISQNSLALRTDRSGNGKLKFTDIHILNKENEIVTSLTSGEDAIFQITIEAKEDINDAICALAISTINGDDKIVCGDHLLNRKLTFKKGMTQINCKINKFPLTSGNYVIRLYAEDGHGVLDWIKDACVFDIIQSDFYNVGKIISINQNVTLVPYTFEYKE